MADDQLSLAIGRGGQNARLAARLTNLKIDLINESQYAERLEFQRRPKTSLSEIPGIGDKIKEKLENAGFESAEDLSRAKVEDLAAINGIGEKTAGKVIEAAKEIVKPPEAQAQDEGTEGKGD